MALTVNTNVLSLNAQRNLNKSGKALAKSLERLSSGVRINRAGDDAAGLAISESLRSQIRGLNQAVRNANDGNSLIATAEGATDEANNLLQRIRELAIQSASDTNSASNRAAIQEEVTALLSELDRIATTVEFNGTKLLDGSFTAKKIHVGAFANQTITISLTSIRTTSLGQVAESAGAVVTAALTAGDLTINGTDVGASTTDSAIDIASAINSVQGSTSVTGVAQASVRTGTIAAVQAITLDGSADSLVINGTNIGSVTVVANDSDSALRNAINAASNSTGVTATIDSSNKLVLTADDGRNIVITTTGGDGSDLGVGEALGLVADGGATEEDNVTADTTRGTIKLTSDKAFSIAGNAPGNAGFSATTIGLDATTAINTISVTTQISSNTAIGRIDNALRQLSSNRASLGALTSRLESTVASLQSIAENLSASDSRIRDADFAAETAILTRNQILQQAGVAILAQANALPQLALSLLG